MTKSVSIVLVDDSNLFRQGIAQMLTHFGHTILYECSNGIELINKMERDNLPDLIMLDTDMPEMNGAIAMRWLNKNFPEVKVMAMYIQDDEQIVRSMMENGARTCICKTIDPDELKRVIAAVMAR